MSHESLLSSLRLPLMAAPMSIASSVELVAATSRAGVLGCFPMHNAYRGSSVLEWLRQLTDAAAESAAHSAAGSVSPAPFAVNVNVSRALDSRHRRDGLAACAEFQVPVITTNAGNPAEVIKQVHDWGGIVVHDATTVEQARRAVDAGVDGLMLVCAGAGGLGGTLNPFAFVPEVRGFFDGLIQVAGGIATGRGIAAAQALGADMACMGTRFIATVESGAPAAHKQMLVDVGADDVLYTSAICGIPGSFLRSSIRANGLDPDELPATLPAGVKPWQTVWSGGQSVALIDAVLPVADLVEELALDYAAARR